MHVYDASCRANARVSIYEHFACGWGAQNKCQNLCIAGLVGAKKIYLACKNSPVGAFYF